MVLLAESVQEPESFAQPSGSHRGATQPMKIQESREAGSTLLVVMMITGIIMLALGSYLNLASQEHKTVRRSLCWNAALPMAEAGIEEALSHLNRNTNNYALDGWTTNQIRERTLGDGKYNVNFTGNPGNL